MTSDSNVQWLPAPAETDLPRLSGWGEASIENSWQRHVFSRAVELQEEMGSAGPTPAAVRTMMVVLSRSMWPDTAVPAVVGTFDRGIQLEWHRNGVDLEVAIDAEGETSAWCDRSGMPSWESDDGINAVKLKKELSALRV